MTSSMAEAGNFSNRVGISSCRLSLVAGGAGQTVDYLVHSNTSDMENYPASLCGYPVFSLVRIAGWNQG